MPAAVQFLAFDSQPLELGGKILLVTCPYIAAALLYARVHVEKRRTMEENEKGFVDQLMGNKRWGVVEVAAETLYSNNGPSCGQSTYQDQAFLIETTERLLASRKKHREAARTLPFNHNPPSEEEAAHVCAVPSVLNGFAFPDTALNRALLVAVAEQVVLYRERDAAERLSAAGNFV